MKFGLAAALICFGSLVAGTAPGSAAEVAGSSSATTATYEAGYVTTQGRGRGIRGGGGRAFIAGGGRGVVVGPRRRGNFGRNAAIGIGAAVIGGIIANEAVRSNRGSNSCGRWDYQCRSGSGWACRQLDRYC